MTAVFRYLKDYYVAEGTNLFLVRRQYDLKYGLREETDFTSIRVYVTEMLRNELGTGLPVTRLAQTEVR